MVVLYLIKEAAAVRGPLPNNNKEVGRVVGEMARIAIIMQPFVQSPR